MEGQKIGWAVTLKAATTAVTPITISVVADTADATDFTNTITVANRYGTPIAFTNGVANIPANLTHFHVSVPTNTDTDTVNMERLKITADGTEQFGYINEPYLLPTTPTTLTAHKNVMPTPTTIVQWPGTDPGTGVKIQRLTDGASNKLIVYGRYTQESTDGKYIMVYLENSTSSQVLDRKTGALVVNLPQIGEVHEMRWDYNAGREHIFYYVKDKKFYEYNMNTLSSTVVKDFATDPVVGGYRFDYVCNDVEGDSDKTSRYWAFMGMVRNTAGSYYPTVIFLWDKLQDKVLRKWDVNDLPFKGETTMVGMPADAMIRPNMVDINPDGTHIILLFERWYTGWNANLAGTEVDGPHAYAISSATSPAVKCGVGATHTGWAKMPDGTDMMVLQNNQTDYMEATPLDVPHDMNGGGRTIRLLFNGDMGWSGGMHFGRAYVKRGFAQMSTYYPNDNTWASNQIVMIPMVRDAVPFRVCHSHNVWPGNDGYRNEGTAANNFQGTRVCWSSNNMDGNNPRGAFITNDLVY